MFAWSTSLGPVGAAFTDRAGGVSEGSRGTLDLALRAPSADADAVAENRRRVVAALTGDEATPVALMRQVHGDTVVTVTTPPGPPPASHPQGEGHGELPEADGLVTALPGVVLMVLAADCVPLLLADPEARLVGAVHAGRDGLARGVVPRAVARLRELGARRLHAWVGPRVCGRCYEVPEPLRAEVAARVPASCSVTSWGTPAIDVGAGVLDQLRAAGLHPADVVDVGGCTREDARLHSHRRDGEGAGRLAGLVWLRPEHQEGTT